VTVLLLSRLTLRFTGERSESGAVRPAWVRIPAIVNTHSGDRDRSEATLSGRFLWFSS
jgi:hypothetical protein